MANVFERMTPNLGIIISRDRYYLAGYLRVLNFIGKSLKSLYLKVLFVSYCEETIFQNKSIVETVAYIFFPYNF